MSSRSELPNDVIYDLLLRLPIKSLARFECVCKAWRSLIRNPMFRKQHLLNRSPGQKLALIFGSEKLSVGLILQDLGAEVTVPLLCDSRFHVRSIQLFGSCDGLLCIQVFNESAKRLELSLWNPYTNEWKRLPETNPPLPFSNYGFGYDPLTDDYKVLKMHGHDYYDSYSNRFLEDYRASIYSLKSNSWRKIKDAAMYILMSNDFIKCCCDFTPSVTLNGSIYWPVHRRLACFVDVKIVSFNLYNENFGVEAIPLPEDSYRSLRNEDVSLQVFNGCLALLIIDKPVEVIDVWVMEKESANVIKSSSLENPANNTNNWIKLMTFSFQESTLYRPIHLLSMSNCEVVMQRLVCYSESEGRKDDHILYDMNGNSSLAKFVDPHHPRKNPIEIQQAMPYVESLVSPHHGRRRCE